ncbi:hypothetical protein [Piscirickettsia litoralis]|nr:hypothetical protein [Piscirickettsia litoralis]
MMVSAISTLIIFTLCSLGGLYLDRKFGTTDLMLDRYQNGALMY